MSLRKFSAGNQISHVRIRRVFKGKTKRFGVFSANKPIRRVEPIQGYLGLGNLSDFELRASQNFVFQIITPTEVDLGAFPRKARLVF